MNGKGDKQRPTNKANFDANFDAICRKKDKVDNKQKVKKNEKPKTV
jgi:ABC-type Zn uptake system ZnuABC Zn-binding protein ZnuA